MESRPKKMRFLRRVGQAVRPELPTFKADVKIDTLIPASVLLAGYSYVTELVHRAEESCWREGNVYISEVCELV